MLWYVPAWGEGSKRLWCQVGMALCQGHDLDPQIPLKESDSQLLARRGSERMQGNNSPLHPCHRQQRTEMLFSYFLRGIWKKKRSGHAARIALEIMSPGIPSQEPKLMQGSLLLLGCPRGKGSWGNGAAGTPTGALSQEESMTRHRASEKQGSLAREGPGSLCVP